MVKYDQTRWKMVDWTYNIIINNLAQFRGAVQGLSRKFLHLKNLNKVSDIADEKPQWHNAYQPKTLWGRATEH